MKASLDRNHEIDFNTILLLEISELLQSIRKIISEWDQINCANRGNNRHTSHNIRPYLMIGKDAPLKLTVYK